MDKNPKELKSLLLKSLQGDSSSYEKFLKQLIPILRNYFSSRLYDSYSIDDLVQETLISIHKAKHTYDINLPVLNWVFSIAYRRYIDFVRKDSRIKKFEISTETFSLHKSNESNIEQSFEFKNNIESVLNKMSERDKKIITLLKIENYSIKEAAKILKISESALKVAAHRAYKKIKKILYEEDQQL